MTELLDTYFRFHATALALRAERQTILASNIANADTPHYQARDMNFSSVLQQAMMTTATRSTAPAYLLKTSHPLHIAQTQSPSQSAGRPLAPALLYRVPFQDSIDGNTVELDTERAQFADNALRYEAALSEVNSNIRNLSSVLQGQ